LLAATESDNWTIPGCNVEATLAARPAGVTAFVLLEPAIVSALVARATPPICVVAAGVKEMEPPTTLMPPEG